MRVLGLCSYPIEAAATRFRMSQFVAPLNDHGIDLTILPFLDSDRFAKLYSHGKIHGFTSLIRPLCNRIVQALQIGNYDLIFIQREAMIFGPAVFEWIYQQIGRLPVVLDLDDATYVSYVSPRFGRLGSMLKFFGKTDKLIRRASAVTCGNRLIAEYVASKGTRAVVIPTLVDTKIFRPGTRANPVPVIGWIGTHSTFPFLEKLFPVLSELAETHQFVLRVIGSGGTDLKIPNVNVETVKWDREREISDFQSLDIGLYPIFPIASASVEWLNGKSGFKAIEYMSAGVPFVMSPVGICAEIGVNGITHLNAETLTQWYDHLKKLLESSWFREKMGAEGRVYSVVNFPLDEAVETLARLFKELARC